MEVVPFGEVVMYRLPEVARGRHQPLEERWGKGLWLRHARHRPEAVDQPWQDCAGRRGTAGARPVALRKSWQPA